MVSLTSYTLTIRKQKAAKNALVPPPQIELDNILASIYRFADDLVCTSVCMELPFHLLDAELRQPRE